MNDGLYIIHSYWEVHIYVCGKDKKIVIGNRNCKSRLEEDLVKFARNKWKDIPENVRSEKDLREYLGPDEENDYMTWEFREIRKIAYESS